MSIEIRSFSYDELPEGENRKISGRAVIFEQESRNLGSFTEIIHRGAISPELLTECDIKLNYNHDNTKIIARSRKGTGSLSLNLTDEALIYETELPKTQLGEEIREGLVRKDLFESSFAFVVDSERWEKRSDGTYLRHIDKIKSLHDVSIVADGAYANTDVDIATRSLENFIKTSIPTETEEIPAVCEEVRSEETEVIPEPVLEERGAEHNNITEAEQVEEKRSAQTIIHNHNNNINMEFSLLKTISDTVNNRNFNESANAILEEGRKELRASGLSFSGQIQLPLETRAAIQAFGAAGTGAEAVKEEKFSILDPLYANMVLAGAGATFLTGLQGEVSIPMYSGSSCTWVGELAPASNGEGTFSEVKLSPKRITGVIEISKSFLNLTDASAEAMLRKDLIKQLSSKIEATVFGTVAGSTTQPAGLLNGITQDTTAITHAGLVAMERSLDVANVGSDRKFIVSPQAKATLKTTAKASNYPSFLMDDNNSILGYDGYMTSNVASNGVLFGDFSEVVVGMWNGLDLIVDPYSLASKGCVKIVASMYVDVKLRRAGAVVGKILKA